ncbi:hypothetical protein CERZMDRAFT_90506 [Cercospora zeae-maydis SCOH1-5]|uniref:Uncharacterized protein n=1 Tax=Cercospora zeae-maydis SCOH1-5 TaxID=717836 RepID=A0A6A6FKC9_9PEZI|nr:hypothetical protein CERZMDRAFT_90506 [Cercospora zeae-maydis SCOH1-5]
MSASPEQSRRPLANGVASSPAKRKRGSMSEATSQMSPKRAKISATLGESRQQSVIDEDAELARVLQAENNGLRRRTSIVSR